MSDGAESGCTERSRAISGRAAESAIMSLAARQHGVVSRVQLLRAGISPDVIDRRLLCGLLRALHRGVYAVGPVMSAHAKMLAATLACGESAAVSHRSAAALWQIPPGVADDDEVDVRAHMRRRHAGIRVHYAGMLRPDDVTTIAGIRVTKPALTLCDLAATVGARDLERAVAEAFAKRLVSAAEVLALLSIHPGRAGKARLRALLLPNAQPALTRSVAEEAFLALIRRAQLPRPEVNVIVGGYEVDFFWRVERLVAEIDGFAFHSSQRSFERDRRRDAVLTASGMRVMRVTWRQIEKERESVLVRLAQALMQGRHDT